MKRSILMMSIGAIEYSQDAGVYSRCVLQLEGGDYSIGLQPDHFDQFNDFAGSVVELFRGNFPRTA